MALRLVAGARADLVKVHDGTQSSGTVGVEGIRLRRGMAPFLAAWDRFAYGEAAERAARLANLSAEAKKLEDLRVVLARDRAAGNNQAGGELAGILAPLLKEAIANWPAAESRELADLADEIYGFIGWSSSKKRKERQELIAALRSKA